MNCHSGPEPELSIAQVLKVFLPGYLQTHALPVHHLKILRRLQSCRSGELGWSVWRCQDCQRTHWQPNGCGDRHCPACQQQRSSHWLEKQRAALLPVRYFHWVFTLPALLRPLVLRHQRAIYNLLFESASATLLQFGQERFGAEMGLTALLHTWGQNLMDHPHLHCLVSGGGLTAQNTWVGPQQSRWLFPVQAVAQMFQGKFCAGLLRLHATGQLEWAADSQALQTHEGFAAFLRTVRARRWVVFAKGSVVGPEAVLQYLGRYTHRVAIANSRLRSIDPVGQTVTFTYKDYATGGQSKLMTLSGDEFIRRLLLHMLPVGFTKIRHYGLLGNNRRQVRIPLARQALIDSPWRWEPKAPVPPPPSRIGSITCPYCQGTQLRCLGRVDRSGKLRLFQLCAIRSDTNASVDTS